MAQTVKRLPTMQETWVRSLGREDPLEKEMATHSSSLAWKSPWTEKPGRLQSMGHKESDMTEQLHFHFTLPKKVCLVKAMVFPVVMYGCESWTIKKAEH